MTTTVCGHHWDTGPDESQIGHLCSRTPEHVGMPHWCRCGETTEYRHDDDADDAVDANGFDLSPVTVDVPEAGDQ